MEPDSLGIFKKHPSILIIISIVIIEFVIGYVTFGLAVEKEQSSLIDRTETVAAALDAHEILELRGDMTDEDLPAYHELKQKLIRVAQVNTDVTSVYVTGFRNSEIFFYADSVASGEVDEATPGLVYDEGTPLFKTVFTVGRTVFEGPVSDRWGSWVSGLVPIIEPVTGRVIASVGLDIDSSIYRRNIAIATLVPMLVFGIVFLLGLVGYVRYKKNKEVLMLRAKFVSIASHELRSPVSGIVWAAQSLLGRADAALSAATREIVTQIEKTGRQVLGTVGEILDLSKLQGAQGNRVVMNGVDMAALIAEIVQSLTLVAQQAGIRVRVHESLSSKLLVLCDKEKTQRVISNILTNALKYSKQNGEVVIGYQHEEGSHVISVQDDGVGIPAAEQGKIFQSNFRASNVERSLIAGTGIGLHLVKELMERQGGSVRFISKPGAGTTFFIQLKDR